MGKIEAICISEKRGTVKYMVEKAMLIEDFGIEGDAHAGKWHRQVSLLALEKSGPFHQAPGAFGENLLVTGFDLSRLPTGTRLQCGEAILKLPRSAKNVTAIVKFINGPETALCREKGYLPL